MLFLIEIALAVVASKRGWKGWAALPIAIGIACGVVIAVVTALTGADETLAFGLGICIDGVIALTLAVMAVAGGPLKNAAAVKPPQTDPTTPGPSQVMRRQPVARRKLAAQRI